MIHRSIRFACLMTALAAVPCQAQSWAMKMFAEERHDFGVVARGAEVVYQLPFKNVFDKDVHITNVKTACGCTAAEVSKDTVKSGETAYIRIEMDTKRFSKQKDSAIIISIDRPLPAEVRIPVSVYIRTDVVLTPGSVNFGAVDLGTMKQAKVDVAYAGRPDWKIKEVTSLGKYLDARVVEKSRSGGSVAYEVHFRLAEDTPVGVYRHQVQIITDDANAPRVPLLVEATVEADLSVTPPVLAMGTVTPGQVVRKTVVMRGKAPFAIDRIECESDMEAFATRLPKDERKVHVLPLTFTAPMDHDGDFVEEFSVTIPGRPDPVIFKAYGTIAKN